MHRGLLHHIERYNRIIPAQQSSRETEISTGRVQTGMKAKSIGTHVSFGAVGTLTKDPGSHVGVPKKETAAYRTVAQSFPYFREILDRTGTEGPADLPVKRECYHLKATP